MIGPAPKIDLFTAGDGYRFAVRTWENDTPTAEVVFLHGIVSHGGWYLASCRHLAQRGFRVHFLERRGSGLNLRDRGHVDRWETWLNDVESYLRSLEGGAPRILLGISWGGNLAAAVARRSGHLLGGVGFLCPGIYSRKDANWFQRNALRVLVRIGMAGRRVAIPLQDPGLFTSSESGKSYIATDPLALWRITISFAAANLQLVRYARDAPKEIRMPAMLMLAGDDPITDNGATAAFFEKIGHGDRKLIEYPGASHTLEFEPNPTPYFSDLASWCETTAHSAAGAQIV